MFALFIRLVRLPNLIIIFLTQLIARIYLFDLNQKWSIIFSDTTFLLISLSTIFTAAAGYIINDYYDVKIDFINNPNRVIIDKHVSRRTSLFLNFVFNLLSLICAVVVSTRFFLFVLFSICLLWFYSNYLKRTLLLGNITIALLTCFVLLSMVLYYRVNWYAVICFIFSAFFISLIREIIKDMEDLEGDRRYGCKTLPIVVGEKYAKKVVYVLLITFSFSGTIMFYFLSDLMLFYFMFPVLFNIVIACRLYFAQKKHDYRQISLLCKAEMLIGLSGMFALSL